jgi:predicted hydrocarbon binding protein
MHGSILVAFERYAATRLGAGGLAQVRRESGIGEKVFLAVQTYSDEDAFSLIGTTSRITATDVHVLLEDFGRFLAPELISMYGMLADPRWRTLEFLENVESTIHRVVRLRNPGAQPPEIRCERTNVNEAVVTYGSARRLCALARGLIHGVAGHYGQRVTIQEPSCMHRHAPHCRILVRIEN